MATADSLVSPGPHPELSSKLEKQRERLTEALQALLDALAKYGDRPRKKTSRQVYKEQERFESRVDRLHQKVLRRTGTPLVSTWAYMWDELAWSGPVVLRTVFDVREDETPQSLLTAIAETLEGLAPDDFSLASATPVNS